MARTWNKESVAVWDGRFQPLHRGHIDVIASIIEQFRTRLAVMIIQSSEGSVDAYSATVNVHHRLARNPLTFWERYTMLKLALRAVDLGEQVTILGIPRPDLHWDIARSFYPDNHYICLTGKDEYERQKEVFWSALGEQTRTVNIDAIPKFSATDFKLALKEGRDWQRYLPSATIGYFEQIDGPNRFRSAET